MKSEYQEKEIRRWFKDHKAKYFALRDDSGNGVEKLVWQKPGTMIFKVIYLIDNCTLFVNGDLGQAVYRWSSPISFKSLSGFNLGYFAEKCDASEEGRQFTEWSEVAAEEGMEEHFRIMAEDRFDECTCDLEVLGKEDFCPCLVKIKDAALQKFKDTGGWDALYNRNEWVNWLNCDDNGYKIIEHDFWEWAYGVGEQTHIRCRAHLEGIKMAVEGGL